MSNNPKSKKWCTQLLSFFRQITVEPFLFGYAFSIAITAVTQTTFMMDKICRTQMHYDNDICDNVLKDPSLLLYKQEIQKELSQWYTIINYMQDIPSFILSIVIGPWSDVHGRKKPMVLVLILKTITFGLTLLNALFMDIPTYGLVLSMIPTCLFGGFIFMLCLSYISDITTPENRTRRFAILSGTSFLGFPTGILVGSFILESGGYIAVYLTATVTMVCTCIYTAVRIKETRGDAKIDKSYFLDFFKFSKFKEALKTVCKKREGNRRSYIIASISCLGLVSLSFSVSGITYQYTQLMYTWGNKEYSIFSSTTTFFNKLVNMFITPFLSGKLNFRETTIGIIGVSCLLCAMVLISLAKVEGLFWAGGALDGMVFMSSVTSRSILSTSVDPSEVGKAFGIASAFESIGSFIGGQTVQMLYRATLKFFPSCTYFMSAFVALILLSVYLWMDVDMRDKESTRVVSAVEKDDAELNGEIDFELQRFKSLSVASGLNIDNFKNI
ncbi:Proton-coupled folate transporter [Nymphon striatum]|nr:Proton-coupled folate transporter [Nymphon striatum]